MKMAPGSYTIPMFLILCSSGGGGGERLVSVGGCQGLCGMPAGQARSYFQLLACGLTARQP
jgi:hypothetical protein